MHLSASAWVRKFKIDRKRLPATTLLLTWPLFLYTDIIPPRLHLIALSNDSYQLIQEGGDRRTDEWTKIA
jgi:hypothetical protein